MSLAVVGTDTGVGKTVVAALLLARYAGELPVAYWKPVATGSDDERDRDTVEQLTGGAVEILPEQCLFRAPLSPHLAARLEGRPIDVAAVVAAFPGHPAAGRQLVVEGVGGLLVPLADDGTLFPELLQAWRLPSLVVARSTLGTINHTLLTLEALERRGLDCLGVVLNGPPNAENRAAIERFGRVPVVGELAELRPLDAQQLAAAARSFDRRGTLAPHLGGAVTARDAGGG